MGTMGGMSAVIAGGPAVYALMPPLGCVLCHAFWPPEIWTVGSWSLNDLVLNTFDFGPDGFFD